MVTTMSNGYSDPSGSSSALTRMTILMRGDGCAPDLHRQREQAYKSVAKYTATVCPYHVLLHEHMGLGPQRQCEETFSLGIQ